ncbi:MAG: AgmX/PglI C-terminal domain-containing protein [Polyangiaceae bacterium]
MRLFITPLLALVAVSAACAAGCGGSSPPATTPPAGSSSATSPPVDQDAGPTTTTTTTLGSGSDLSGTKLTTASSSTVQTADSSAPTPGPHQQEPGRSVTDIRTIVMSHRDEARKCYDDNLQMYPGVEGDLDVKFTIDPKGTVTDAAVNDDKSSIHAAGIGSCVVGVIKKIHFAESAKGFETRAHYPFNFHPKGKVTGSTPPPSK